nr:hypothetical protein [Nanoarchaeota archaeon]
MDKEAIFKIVQLKGPVIPNQLKKELGGDTLLLAAVLSELASEGKVKVSNTKIGGTPAYYAPGTEVRLQNIMKYLNPKDRQTAEYLRQKKVLKDSELSPLVRVSLRNIRDFAKPLEVSVKGQREIYWKWYLLPTKEAEQMILKKIRPMPKAPIKKEVKKIEVKKEEIKKEIKVKKEPLVLARQKLAREKEVKEEVQKEISKTEQELEKEKDVFFRRIWGYFKQNDIEIIEYKIIRKKSDIEFTIAVPSRIGSQEYYCKAKSKKKVNDGDLSSAYIQGQAKKLPVIFIAVGELTKKAKEMLAKDFKGMIVKKI